MSSVDASYYSPLTGFVFLFNLIVGAGALAIPHAFAQVGLIYGICALCVLGFTSYISATFVIEAIAGVNALRRLRNAECSVKNTSTTAVFSMSGEEEFPLLGRFEEEESTVSTGLYYDVSEKIELANVATELFSSHGLAAFYTCMTAYLYGDLAIYAVAISKCVREAICPRPSMDVTVWECPNVGLTSSELYRVFVGVFGIALGSFAFGHMQKTKCIQLVTTVMRHASFTLMIILALIGIFHGQGRSTTDVLAHENLNMLPDFFGVCIYSFMCHHSIPGIIAPIKRKQAVGRVLISAFIAVIVVYTILSVSATFRFLPKDVEDVYTLNFDDYPIRPIAFFLSLFPVFTLSTSFPIISITLRGNLQTLFQSQNVSIFAIAAVLPPVLVAMCTENVGMLVGLTGAYAGLGIQWVIPACLVYSVRQRIKKVEDQMGIVSKNPHKSPFSHANWVYLSFGFSIASLVLITAKERKRDIIERKLRDLAIQAGRYQSKFQRRNYKTKKSNRLPSKQPWESLFMRKSRHEKRIIIQRPWEYPMAAQNLAAIAIQKLARGYIGRKKYRKQPKRHIRMSLMHRFIAKHNGDYEDREGFKKFCILRIQAWYRMYTLKWNYILQRHPMYHIAAMQIQYKWRMYYHKAIAIHEMTPRDKAASRIQILWRRYTNRRIYRYYRDLIHFRNSGDPMLMLKAINPSEAHLLDAATGAQVRFRLGGCAFPPTIYYKIFVRGAVCDMNAFSPKDYTTAHQVGPRNVNIHPSKPGVGVTKIIRVGNAYYGANQCGSDVRGWYRRWDNNGWRPVTSKVIAPTNEVDPITIATANKRKAHHHLRVVRQQQVLQQRKEKKRQWMKQMQHVQSNTSDNNAVPPQEEIDFESEDWEEQADEIFDWASGLNFDHYLINWTTLGTTNTAKDEILTL
ncbi:hypothetical protein THRCLA_02345 [Thraustotheca clavata]|uniref:Amino acid transporter transmembrane domain-containing protein n=1 Tax=Thraustotheca clavata TaxID=74557 RepID=A0A1W0A670_9STRA|nr:hypothetical protein THRCLA_02345 [Thraustotheca clavata]